MTICHFAFVIKTLAYKFGETDKSAVVAGSYGPAGGPKVDCATREPLLSAHCSRCYSCSGHQHALVCTCLANAVMHTAFRKEANTAPANAVQ